MVRFMFAGQEWSWADARALYWPAQRALVVADLHLEKGSWYAERGQMLPPYDSRETLERLTAAVKASGARRLFCLGDSFHDSAGPARMEPVAADLLVALGRMVEVVWIVGNHDGGDLAVPVGEVAEEIALGGVALRHQAAPGVGGDGSAGAELSGHFHPKLRATLRGRRIARPCAVASESRMILPAYGALTGGMDAADPAILAALRPAQAIDALLPAAGRLTRFALWRADGADPAPALSISGHKRGAKRNQSGFSPFPRPADSH